MNDGAVPSESEISWVIASADANGDGVLFKREIFRAVAVWYPRVYRRHVATPPPLSDIGSERRVQARRAMLRHVVELGALFQERDTTRTGIFQSSDLEAMMADLHVHPLWGIDFVLCLADIDNRAFVPADSLKHALALALAIGTVQGWIDATIKRHVGTASRDGIDGIDAAQVEALLSELNDEVAPSEDELAWVVAPAAEAHCKDVFAELRRSVFWWFVHVHTRHDIATDVKPAGSTAEAGDAGAWRRAVTMQLPVHRAWVESAFRHSEAMGKDGSISRQALANLMAEVGDGTPVPSIELEVLMQIADVKDSAHIQKADVLVAVSLHQLICLVPLLPIREWIAAEQRRSQLQLAMWRGLQAEFKYIDENFSVYDESNSGRLTPPQVRRLLTDLNGGIPPTNEELKWVISAGKIAGQPTKAVPEIAGASSERHNSADSTGSSCCYIDFPPDVDEDSPVLIDIAAAVSNAIAGVQKNVAKPDKTPKVTDPTESPTIVNFYAPPRVAAAPHRQTKIQDGDLESTAARPSAAAAQAFLCPITHAVMQDPVVDNEGNSYERSAIEQWLRDNNTSPVTRSTLHIADLRPNRALKDMVEQWIMEQAPERTDEPGLESRVKGKRPPAITVPQTSSDGLVLVDSSLTTPQRYGAKDAAKVAGLSHVEVRVAVAIWYIWQLRMWSFLGIFTPCAHSF
eukprot:SAG11_NODE_395_length_9822_cov_4.886043_3_plen_687_part_00